MTSPSPACGGQRHLVSVWNPSYTSDDVMDAHLKILLRAADEVREQKAEADTAYVWWGKLRSSNRAQDALEHERDILEIEEELKGDGGAVREAHIYLTDYRSLYVGHIDEITRDDMAAEEPDRVPPYYRERGFSCDFWFKLLDLRRIVSDDLVAVIEELKKLRNRHYFGKPVSLYGGMVNLPLIVERPDGARHFDPEVRRLLAEDMLWAQFDAARAGNAAAAGSLQRDLRENLFGDEAWLGLEPSAREFIASAERIVRDHRGDASYDFTPVILNLTKALEVQAKSLLVAGLATAPREARLAKLSDRTVDVVLHGLLTLGDLTRVLNEEPRLRQALSMRLRDGSWFVNDFPRAIEGLRDVRNRAAHSEPVGREEALAWRNDLLGIGCQGVIVRLGGVRPLEVRRAADPTPSAISSVRPSSHQSR